MKSCRFNPNKRCYHSCCSLIDGMGNVVVCSLHSNPSGFFSERKFSPVIVSLWNKHLKGGS
jgi:hypothetical protein